MFSKNQTDLSVPHAEQEMKTSDVFQCVLKGNKKAILKEVKAALLEGKEPGTIINEELIPAINEVGRLFEAQTYFYRS